MPDAKNQGSGSDGRGNGCRASARTMIGEWAAIWGRIRQNRFLQRLGLLSGGTVIGQALVVLSSPLLTRLYTPEEFGLFAIFSAFCAIIGVAIGLRYEFAVPVVEKEEDAVALVALTASTSLVLSALLTCILLFWGTPLANAVGVTAMPDMLWLLPPSVLLWGVGSGLSFWAIRQGHFRLSGVNRVVQFGTQAGGQVAFGLIGLGTIGLVVGYTLGYVMRLAHLAMALPRLELARLCRPSASRVRHVLRSQWAYPVFSASSSILQSACHMLPAVLIALLYGPAMAGLFALAQRVVGLPVRLFSDSASQAFLGEVATADRRRLHQLFKKTTLLFLGIGVVGMLPLLLAGPSLFAVVFGESWREAGVIVQILVPLHLARFVVRPISQTLNVLQRQDLHLVSASIEGLALGLSFTTGWWLGLEAGWTLALFSLSSSGAWILYILLAWWHVRRASMVAAG